MPNINLSQNEIKIILNRMKSSSEQTSDSYFSEEENVLFKKLKSSLSKNNNVKEEFRSRVKKMLNK